MSLCYCNGCPRSATRCPKEPELLARAYAVRRAKWEANREAREWLASLPVDNTPTPSGEGDE